MLGRGFKLKPNICDFGFIVMARWWIMGGTLIYALKNEQQQSPAISNIPLNQIWLPHNPILSHPNPILVTPQPDIITPQPDIYTPPVPSYIEYTSNPDIITHYPAVPHLQGLYPKDH